MNTNAPSVKMRGDKVCVFYGEKQALFEVDLEVPEKMVTALIGPRVAASLPSCVRLTA